MAPLHASESPRPNEPKCGAIFAKAFAKAEKTILKASVGHIVADCNGATEFGPELTERIQDLADKTNEKLFRFICDPDIPFLQVSSFLAGQTTGEAFLNAVVTDTCNGV